MQLSAVIDSQLSATAAGIDIPCRTNDAELWFVERPEVVEFA